MLNVNALKAEMARKGYTQTALAEKIGVSQKTFSSRLKTGDFCSKEIEVIISTLDLNNPMEIFFVK